MFLFHFSVFRVQKISSNDRELPLFDFFYFFLEIYFLQEDNDEELGTSNGETQP